MHYNALLHRRKSQSTLNPNYPKGTHKPFDLYHDHPSHGIPLSTSTMDEIEAAVYDRDLHYLSPWQIDPLMHHENREMRTQLFNEDAASAPGKSLSDAYIALRQITRTLVAHENGF